MNERRRIKRKVRKSGTAVAVTSTNIEGQEPQTAIRREVVHGLPPDPIYLSVGNGFTENVGDYESVKIHVSLSVPTADDDSSIRKTYRRITALLEELVEMEHERIIGDSE